jgi:phosphohistidine phosphatase SixA
MDLYLIRHADAVPRGAPGYDDDDRPLTDLGRDQARRLGVLFGQRKLRPGAIVTSPLLRATQTTESFLTGLPEDKPEVLPYEEVGSEMRPKRVARYLEKLGETSVALVGHQPSLGWFLAWLIGSKKARVDLEKCGFALVSCEEFEKGGGMLKWIITPDWF